MYHNHLDKIFDSYIFTATITMALLILMMQYQEHDYDDDDVADSNADGVSQQGWEMSLVTMRSAEVDLGTAGGESSSSSNSLLSQVISA